MLVRWTDSAAHSLHLCSSLVFFMASRALGCLVGLLESSCESKSSLDSSLLNSDDESNSDGDGDDDGNGAKDNQKIIDGTPERRSVFYLKRVEKRSGRQIPCSQCKSNDAPVARRYFDLCSDHLTSLRSCLKVICWEMGTNAADDHTDDGREPSSDDVQRLRRVLDRRRRRRSPELPTRSLVVVERDIVRDDLSILVGHDSAWANGVMRERLTNMLDLALSIHEAWPWHAGFRFILLFAICFVEVHTRIACGVTEPAEVLLAILHTLYQYCGLTVAIKSAKARRRICGPSQQQKRPKKSSRRFPPPLVSAGFGCVLVGGGAIAGASALKRFGSTFFPLRPSTIHALCFSVGLMCGVSGMCQLYSALEHPPAKEETKKTSTACLTFVCTQLPASLKQLSVSF